MGANNGGYSKINVDKYKQLSLIYIIVRTDTPFAAQDMCGTKRKRDANVSVRY